MENKQEQKKEEITRLQDRDYITSLAGLVIAVVLVLLAAMPVIFLVIGFSVRLYRWAAG